MTSALDTLTAAAGRPPVPGRDRGPWIALADGYPWYPLDPHPADLKSWEPLATALSRESRFAGHQRVGLEPTLSVAQHCCHVADSLPLTPRGPFPSALRLAGLLHDAPEGLGLRDLPTPVKGAIGRITCGPTSLLDVYRDQIEAPCLRAVHAAAGLPAPALTTVDHRALDHADRVALATEIRDLMPDPRGWTWDPTLPPPRTDLVIHPWPAAKAAMEYLARLRAWLPDHAPLQA